MKSIRLVCRQSDGEERKVMVAAADFSAILSTASEKVGCATSDILLHVKDEDDLWEIEETFWPSLKDGQTLYAQPRAKKSRAHGKRKASNASAAAENNSDSASGAANEGIGRPTPRKRKSVSRPSGGPGSSSTVGINTTDRTNPPGPSSSSSAVAAVDHPSASSRITPPPLPPLDTWAAQLRHADVQSSHKKWDAKADAILWNRLRASVQGKNRDSYSVAERMGIFEDILSQHGSHGTVSRALAGRNASALNARARKKINIAIKMSLPLPDGLRELYIKPRNEAQPSQSKSRSPSAHRRGKDSGGEGSGGTRSNRSPRQRQDSFVVIEDSSGVDSDSYDEDSDVRSPQQGFTTPGRNGRRISHSSSGLDTSTSGPESEAEVSRQVERQTFVTPPLPTFAGNAANRRRWSGPSRPTATTVPAPRPPPSISTGSLTNAPPPITITSNSETPQVRANRRGQADGRNSGNQPPPSTLANGVAQASSSNAIPLRPRTRAAHTRGEDGQRKASSVLNNLRSPPTPLFLAEENARLTQEAQAASNPFLASRVMRQSVVESPQRNGVTYRQEQGEDVDGHRSSAPASGFAPTTMRDCSRLDPPRNLVKDEASEIDELEENEAASKREDGAASDQIEPQVLPTRPPPPFELAPHAVSADIDILQMALWEDWEEARQSVRSIIRSSIPRRQQIEIGEIDFEGAATRLANLMQSKLSSFKRPNIPWLKARKVGAEALDWFYAAVALAIALEVFASTPPEWSVRRTSFAVAGYYSVLQEGAGQKDWTPAQRRFQSRFHRFATASQKLFWSVRCAKNESHFLESDGEDICAAISLVVGVKHGILGRHLANYLRADWAGEMLPIVLRCQVYLERLEASIKFVQRCSEARGWGAVQVVSQHMFPSRGCIQHWLIPEQERSENAREALQALQNARSRMEAAGYYREISAPNPRSASIVGPSPSASASASASAAGGSGSGGGVRVRAITAPTASEPATSMTLPVPLIKRE